MPSTGRRRSAAERVAQIADAACRLALQTGLSGVTLRAVAHEIGVAPGLVAHYAPSMEALVAETFATIVSEELAEVVALARAREGPSAALATVLTSLLQHTRSEVTLIWVQSWAMGERNPDLAQRVREQMDHWRAFLALLIEEGRDRHEFQCEDPQAVAAQVLGMIDGLNAHGLVAWQREQERTRLLLRSVETMLGMNSGDLIEPVSG
jgi:AcrR family transcriptional regulator